MDDTISVRATNILRVLVAGDTFSRADIEEGEPSAGKQEKSSSCKVHSFVSSTGVLMADGATKPISQVKVGDQVADSVPGDARMQTHTVQKVIVTQTDRDFVDLTVKTLASKVGKAVAGFALAAVAIVGTATPASADTSTLTTDRKSVV